MSLVTLLDNGGIAKITLNRPEKLNAFNSELVEDLIKILHKALLSRARLIIFEAEGRGFSGGFDLSEIKNITDGDILLRFVRIEQLLQLVYHSRIATMAMVHGSCYGAAADLVAACHWRVASPDASFRMPGSRFGIILGTRRLTNLVGEDNARRLVLNHGVFNVQEALNCGFLNHVSEKRDWNNLKINKLNQIMNLDDITYDRLISSQRKEHRDNDLAQLVNSATDGSIKERILSYLKNKSDKKN